MVPDSLNVLATIVHCGVEHFAHSRSHVELQGLSCSSVPLTHAPEQGVHVEDPLTFEKLVPSRHVLQKELPALAE